MRQVLAIYKREFSAYFATPLAYVFIVIYLFAMGAFTFYVAIFTTTAIADLRIFFGYHRGFISSGARPSACGCGPTSAARVPWNCCLRSRFRFGPRCSASFSPPGLHRRALILTNLMTARKTAASIACLNDLIDEKEIDLVVTDFEPSRAMLAGRSGLPVISIDNQHCLTNTDVTYPSQYRRDAAAAKMVTRLMVPRAHAYLVTSFFEAKVTEPDTFLFPPILRECI